jgi:ADP-ribose pyrophosphatase YjhB (NUDIX family)
MIVSDTNPDSTIKAMLAADDAIWRPHVTVATVVPRDGRFLLVEEDVRGRIVLNQPAGHLDPDESLQAAAVRETLEETGWDVALDCLLCVQQWRNPDSARHFVRFTFAAVPVRHHPARALDEGILRTLWLDREEIAAQAARLRSPMVLASIDDWIAGRRIPLEAIHWLPSDTASA